MSEILKFLPKSILTKAEKTAEKVSRSLGIKLAGIDVMIDRNLKQVYVIDVNVFSGFPKRKTFNLAKCLAGELLKMHNKGKLKYQTLDRLKAGQEME